MKITELSKHDFERLEWESRPLDEDSPRQPLQIPPTQMQLLALRFRGYFIIGNDLHVMRLEMGGKLRECRHGIPCTWWCVGNAEGKCPEYPFPTCGMPNGTIRDEGEAKALQSLIEGVLGSNLEGV